MIVIAFLFFWRELNKARSCLFQYITDFKSRARRKDIKFKGIFVLFALFILACGITHLFAIYTIWHGSYGWHGILKLITAIVSVLTALALIANRHALLSIPSVYQLELALEKAEAANQAKQYFLATMSHEIRTPINGVMGMLNLAIKNENDIDQAKKLTIAKKSAASLLAVINDIIDFSKVEAGKLEIEKIHFNVCTLLTDTFKSFSFCHPDKNVELLLDTRNVDVDCLVGDPGRIRQVISNLINNAVKFTTQGEIHVVASVECTSSGDYELSCCIKDTGVGIPSSTIEQLFMPFTQADSTTTRKYGGTGLGLAICRQLVRLMGGVITAKSEVGVGSEFSFSIPLELPPVTEEIPNEFSLARVYNTDHSAKTVLLIYANPSAVAIYGGYLTKAKYKVIYCEAVAELINLEPTASSSIDVVLADANLLNAVNDSVLSNFVKLHCYGCNLWLMDHDNDTRFTSKALQITGFIDKPVSPADLFYAVSWVSDKTPIQSPSNLANKEKKYPINILVVEDHVINQTVISLMLEDCVESFSTADNGEEALSMLKSSEKEGGRKFDMIFMDCQMPIMDGYEATKKIRAGDVGEFYKNICIVAMTANSMNGDREYCLAVGMDNYIAKPFEFDRVYEVIDSLHHKISEQ